jgi:hypothetical protein
MLDELRKKVFASTELQPNGCWLWTGQCSDEGYGFFQYNKKRYQVRRVVHEIFIGPLESTDKVLTICTTKLCINYRHIMKGSQKTSGELRVMHNRSPRGGKNGRSKLTPDMVREIRAECARRREAGLRSIHADIARDYGVDKTTIRDIERRKIWRHVD